MKSVFAIIGYFYNSLSIIRILAVIGLFTLLAGLFVPVKELSGILLICGWFLSLGVPFFFSSQFYFWNLLSHGRLGLAPRFYLTAGIALLLFTLLVSQVLSYSLLVVYSPEYIDYLLFERTFLLASALVGIAIVGARYQGAFGVILIPFLMVYWLDFLRSGVVDLFASPTVINLLFILSVLLWAYGLNYLAKCQGIQRPLLGIFGPLLSGKKSPEIMRAETETMANTAVVLQFYNFESPLFIDLLEQYHYKFLGQFKAFVMILIVAPFILVMLFAVLSLFGFSGIKSSKEAADLYFILTLLFPFTLISVYPSKIKQFRKLWLKVGGDRSDTWFIFEKELRIELLCVLICAIFNGLIVLIFNELSIITCVHYSALIMCIYISNVYLGYIGACQKLNDLSAILIGILLSLVYAFVLFIFRSSENPLVIASAPLICIVILMVLRTVAHRSFLKVDWSQINPFRQLSKQRVLKSSHYSNSIGGEL